MMLQQQGGGGVPALIGSSADSVAAAAAAAEAREPGGGGSGGSGGGMNEDEKGRSEESERNSGGSRWPRQETIALLKIRSDMDVAFRDSSLKGPLWDEVSRKLSELGYHRSAKKCKEKFENVYKYHKRTKDGRNTKNDGKTYRFFEQLEALDTHPSLSLMSWSPMKSQPPSSHPTTILTSATMLGNNNNSTHMNANITSSPVVTNVTVSSTPSPISTVFPSNAIHPINISSHNVSSQPTVTISPSIPTQKPIGLMNNHNPNMSFMSNSTSSTSSDEQPERYGKRKRKWEDFFGRLMTEVIQKQDELQQKFLDTLEKREKERIAREEAWRVQEMAKMNREHELLLQERSMSAAKDAAVISFLQKITEQQQQNSPNQIQVQPPQIQLPIVPPPQPPVQVSQPHPMPPTPAPAPVIITPSAPVSAPAPAPTPVKNKDDINVQSSNYNGGSDNANFMSPSPSRWPKAEIQALINFRTTLDTKYHENGPKGPLWEEISAAMRNIGYNRNAKRCKEKWENINKYYKKVKESNKKRPEDAKTCPYFHQLEALYKEKAKTDAIGTNTHTNLSFNSNPLSAPMPIMVQPEQQWPLQEHKQKIQVQDHDQDHSSDNMDDHDHNMNEDDYDDDEDDDDGGAFEIVTNKQQQQKQEVSVNVTKHI